MSLLCRQAITYLVMLLIVVCAFALTGYASGHSPETFDPQQKGQGVFRFEETIGTRGSEAEDVLLDIIKNDLPGKDKALFLLGKIYMDEGDYEKAESYLLKAADAYPLLRDYALKLLTEVYINSEKFEAAVRTSRRIKNRLLLQYARQSEINALMALNKEEEARTALVQYVKRYPEDWDYKLTLAMLLKDSGKTTEAIRLFKDIFINASPLSEAALDELKLLKADRLSTGEILKRASSLYKNGGFQEAEAAYKEVLAYLKGNQKKKILFKIGMCQFRQKHYAESAKSFGLIKTPKAMYWEARSFYRINNRKRFDMVKREFEKRYPGNHRLALLFLMEAEELRRNGRYNDAERIYRKVLNNFPKNTEDALWGLGWVNYISGNYKKASEYFSRLSAYVNSSDYYKYLFWRARSLERLAEGCIIATADESPEINAELCNMKNDDFFKGLPSDESFYGYLIRFRSLSYEPPGRVNLFKPVRPQGRVYERIEALAQLGLRDEAVGEIIDALNRGKSRKEFLYLGYMAMKLDEYKQVISFAEPKKDRELIPYSYPLGYWDTVTLAANSKNLDPHLIVAVIREESRFDPAAVSWAGAVGLMQLMPSTAVRLKDYVKVPLEDSSELQDPKKNILLGTHYLSKLIDEFEELPLAIAAYNAGENTLKRWMTQFDRSDIVEFIENIPYRETRKYVKRVLKSYWQYRTINGLPVDGSGIFCNGKCSRTGQVTINRTNRNLSTPFN